jgi:hypothetical protein
MLNSPCSFALKLNTNEARQWRRNAQDFFRRMPGSNLGRATVRHDWGFLFLSSYVRIPGRCLKIWKLQSFTDNLTHPIHDHPYILFRNIQSIPNHPHIPFHIIPMLYSSPSPHLIPDHPHVPCLIIPKTIPIIPTYRSHHPRIPFHGISLHRVNKNSTTVLHTEGWTENNLEQKLQITFFL